MQNLGGQTKSIMVFSELAYLKAVLLASGKKSKTPGKLNRRDIPSESHVCAFFFIFSRRNYRLLAV